MNSTRMALFAACIVAIMIMLAGCGSSGGTADIDDTYVVYSDGGGSIAPLSAGNSPEIVVVLPSTANVPDNYSAVSNANVTFIQQEESSDGDLDSDALTLTTGDDGRFEAPAWVINSLGGEGGALDVAITLPDGGGMPLFTALPVAGSDNGEAAISLRVVPSDFHMLQGERRVFHALKATPSDNTVIAKNIAWDCDPQDTGVLSQVGVATNGEYVICMANVTGEARVSASVAAADGLYDVAIGTVFDRAATIQVGGRISNVTGAVDAGYLVSFLVNSPVRQRPVHFAGITNALGDYRVYLPPASGPVDYFVLIGTPLSEGGTLYKSVPAGLAVDVIDNGGVIAADFVIGEPLPPMRPRPRPERIIRAAWNQVNLAVRPRPFEPFHGIRLLLSDAVPDGPGQIAHAGMFDGWCYNRQGGKLTITPPAPAPDPACPNLHPSQQLDITSFTVGQYIWTRYLAIPYVGLIKVATGEVTDTFTDGYISNISASNSHLAPTLLGPVLLTTSWDWARTLDLAETGDDDEVPVSTTLTAKTCLGDNVWSGDVPQEACGDGFPVLDYQVSRAQSVDFVDFSSVTGLFDFYGSSTAYFHRIDGTLKAIASDICTLDSPCTLNTDGSGLANVVSFDGMEEISRVSFSIEPANSGDDLASGTLALKVRSVDDSIRELQFTFVIKRYGVIIVTRPDGAVRSFLLQGI